MAVAAFATGFTLCSCGGGSGSGSGNGAFAVSAKEFTSGSKSFYISAMNLWTLRSTEKANNLILSEPDNYESTGACWGEITTGSYDKENAGHAVVLFHYTYFPQSNSGELAWSWDAADPKNVPTEALAMITTIHTLPKEDAADDEEGGKKDGSTGLDNNLSGIGEPDDPTALAEHYKQMRIEFNFNTGMCVLYCGCGAYSQELHFDVRRGQ